jgi:D-alanyl-D-alanine carboxypeptidase
MCAVTPKARDPYRSRTRLGLAAVALVAVVVAGCGGSGPSPRPSAPAATSTAVPTPTPPPTIYSTPTPESTPSAVPSIFPVPTPQLESGGAPAAALTDAKSAALQAALASLRANKAYPGMSAAIAFEDGTVWTGQTGQAVIATQSPVAEQTLFSVGSISKTFVAALVGRLAQRGTIGLDDPLATYVPSFFDAGAITIRQLLNHTSGIMDVFDVPGMGAAITADPARQWTPDEVLARVGQYRYKFEPGKGYHYSNTDYVLLGLVVEKATGETVAELVRTEFLGPLDLRHTFLQTEETATGPEAHGYMQPSSRPHDNSAGTMLPFTAEASVVGPAGAYVSTASDLARWGAALYGGSVLDQATLAAMVDISQTSPFKPRRVYGLGMEEITIAGHVAWGHLGHLDGTWAAMEYLPAYGMTIVVIANAEWCDPIAAAAILAPIAIGA